MAMKPTLAAAVLGIALAGCAGPTKHVRAGAGSLLDVDREAEAAYAAGDHETAIERYQVLLEAMPDDANYWYRLANALVKTGRHDAAALAYQRTLSLDPKNARAWHNLGVVRLHQSQASFAHSVKQSGHGDAVFHESLRLSRAVYSLTDERTAAPASPVPSSPVPSPTALSPLAPSPATGAPAAPAPPATAAPR